MNFHRPGDAALAQQAPREAGLPAANTPERGRRVAAGLLLALSIGYALAATATLPHRLAPTETTSMFLAGTPAGLLVTSVLWMARPSVFGPALPRPFLGVSLAGATGVVALSLIGRHFRA